MPEFDPYGTGRWIPCDGCEDYWCTLHEKHAHDCACPALHLTEEEHEADLDSRET